MAQWLEHFQRTQVFVWQLTIFYSSDSRRFNTLFWIPWALHIYDAQITCRQSTHTRNNFKIVNLFIFLRDLINSTVKCGSLCDGNTQEPHFPCVLSGSQHGRKTLPTHLTKVWARQSSPAQENGRAMLLTPGIKKSPAHTFFFFNLVLKKTTRANTDKSCTTSWIISLLSCLLFLTLAEKR